ncbi:MAG: sugar ABC transporter ATP-binding protein [Anaerohalosphaeraceae bacterium]|nr:sugar ABC transporter ATP-binding protein [Anaerohalosphaeraceae bacterium]
MSSPKLETVGIHKKYPGTVAIDNISIKFEGGNVHALMGKNGAGKSTLVKILAGAVQPTSGKILINSTEVRLHSPIDAFDRGIATVYQELSLVPHLTVAENILLGRLPKRKGLGGIIIDWPQVFARAESLLNDMQVSLDVKAKATDLGVAQQQIVEIAKAMSFNPSVIMLDEPTSALAQHETENLFRLIRKLAQKDVAIIYITHRLGELQRIADTVTVLRDGKYIDTVEMKKTTPEKIAHMMFGEIIQKKRPVDIKASEKTVMEVRNLERKNSLHGINFTLREGEVLGIAGMLGSGRTELLRAIFGAEPFDDGEIILDGVSIRNLTPARMNKLGVALMPENRKEEGLVQVLSTRANMCLAGLERISTRGFTTKARERTVVNRLVEKLDIRVSDIEQAVSSLSGGNQQKVIVGNWLNTNPRIILFDEPTRGIDVKAKQQIFQIIWDLSQRKISSIFVSSELEELLEVCHRILIMKRGQIVDEVQPQNLSADDLFVLCQETNQGEKICH